jgi:predicted dehydrogenase
MPTVPADQTIRWGIVGCGDVTEVKSGPGFQKAAHSALVAVMRRNGALAADYARRHGVPRWYDDADALIHDPEVDAVYVATPPDSHLEYALRAARAGKPVYVEKPMARTADECRTMIDACRAAGVPLFVAYYRRALPRFVRIRELIESGAVGEVRLVNVTLHQPLAPEELDPSTLPWRVDPRIAGGGRFVDLASHMLDFLDHALGPIRDVQGFAANQGGRYAAEDVVAGSFVFASGVLGAGSWCFTAGTREDRTEIIGTAGRISYATFGTEPIVVTTSAGTSEIAIGHPAHIQQPLIQTVVDALRGVGTCPSMGESAARTSWVMDRMLAGRAATSSTTGWADAAARPTRTTSLP